MKCFFRVIIGLVAFSNLLMSQNWELVWSDEFDGTNITESNWTHEIGGHGWGNNELQYYTDRDTNSYINSGYLIVQALEENFSSWNYTSARLKSQGKRFFKYGKILARIKLPYGKGMWPAFWMLGENFPVVGWPDCGEIDIMELVGGTGGDNTVYGTAHWENESGQHAQYGGSYTLSSGIFADSFHLFSIIWDEEKIRWYVDNHFYHEIDITPASLSELHGEFFVILNVAVGGNWPGPPDPTTVFPQKMEIDYVRVYRDSPVSFEDESDIPSELKLYQNYPNPFNPSTIISWQSPVGSWQTLRVYDTLGNEVAKLVDEFKPAGRNSIEFISTDLPSGIYFYKLQADRYIRTKKMVIMK